MDEAQLKFLNELAIEITRQLQEFDASLPEDMQAGVVINGAVIAVERVTRLFRFGRLVICGICANEAPPLSKGGVVRVLIQPLLPNLTLTAVPRKETSPKKPIGIECSLSTVEAP